MKVKISLIGALLITLLLSACGGGGGSNPAPSSGSSNWDKMTWDQDNWS